MKNLVIVCTIVVLTLFVVSLMISCQQPTPASAPSTSPAIELNDRGVALVKEGQLEQAISEFSQAIELNPSNASVYNNRGSVYAEKGQYDLSIADFKKVVELSADPLLINLAKGYIKKLEYFIALGLE